MKFISFKRKRKKSYEMEEGEAAQLIYWGFPRPINPLSRASLWSFSLAFPRPLELELVDRPLSFVVGMLHREVPPVEDAPSLVVGVE